MAKNECPKEHRALVGGGELTVLSGQKKTQSSIIVSYIINCL